MVWCLIWWNWVPPESQLGNSSGQLDTRVYNSEECSRDTHMKDPGLWIMTEICCTE